MHRLVAVLLILLYLPAALNATVTAHYCMGRLTGVDVLSSVPAGNVCSRCSMIKQDRKGCCHDKQETLQLNTDQLSSFPPDITTPFTATLKSHYFLISDTHFAVCANTFHKAHSPPLLSVSSLLLHCVFRI